MARAPLVTIDGNELRNVVEVQWAVEVRTNPDNLPTRGFITTGVMIRRTLDENDTLVSWASDPDSYNRKPGQIRYCDARGLAMKIIEWEEGYVFDYRTEFNESSGHLEEIARIEVLSYKLIDERNGMTETFRPHADVLPQSSLGNHRRRYR